MRILALDTTTPFFSLAIYDNGKVYEYNLKTKVRLSKLLAPIVKSCLDALNLKPLDIDYFAVGAGPGSFTGIRLGLSFVKGLGLALKKPLISFSTLDIMALNCRLTDKKIMPAIDAKRALIYTCEYRYKNEKISRFSPYLLIGLKDFLKRINSPSVVFGDALYPYKDEILRKSSKVSFLDRDLWYPKAHNIITLALERISKEKKRSNLSIKPIYLYPDDCQVKR
ncbi:MAG: tRNA (adenosine(37)-N6)-threonylcarbamoyltransferase complex dimerization subunit type 1 TsaB [Candidatus Omnitrophota bacterium]